MSPPTFDMMNGVESSPQDQTEDDPVQFDEEGRRRSGEVYDVLCQFCVGEMLSIVRSSKTARA